ncbi:SLC12A transporter family like protein [Aduncisulcus paluster]|uniref:SLC12A transporter family like protein n=1 Tax=Aduncisulcus paluster TaxID=2918883 RepID=A0ABQ5JR11_9EUKA|nr:SLC12A transporter family like protein [Aduncisulcus paluster]
MDIIGLKRQISFTTYGSQGTIHPTSSFLIQRGEMQEGGSFDEEEARYIESQNIISKGGLGIWAGVFTKCCLTILCSVLFQRVPYIISHLGVGITTAMVLFVFITVLITSFSLSSLSSNGKIGGGGIYKLISRSIGPIWGTTTGTLVYLANSLSISLFAHGIVNLGIQWMWKIDVVFLLLTIVSIICCVIAIAIPHDTIVSSSYFVDELSSTNSLALHSCLFFSLLFDSKSDDSAPFSEHYFNISSQKYTFSNDNNLISPNITSTNAVFDFSSLSDDSFPSSSSFSPSYSPFPAFFNLNNENNDNFSLFEDNSFYSQSFLHHFASLSKSLTTLSNSNDSFLSHSALMSYYSSSSQSHLFLDPYYSPSETTETPVTSSTSSSSFQFRSFFSLSNFRKSFKPPSSSASTSGFSTILSSFRSSLALFLPAVSRISLGTTISGSLKNAQIAIPQGTLFSLLGGLIVYLAIVWVCGLGVDVETLMYPDSSDSSLTSLTFKRFFPLSFCLNVLLLIFFSKIIQTPLFICLYLWLFQKSLTTLSNSNDSFLSHSALMSYYSSSSQSHLFLDPYYSPSETTETPVTSSTSSSSFQFRSFFSLSNFRKSFKPPSSSASTSGFSTILSSFRSSLSNSNDSFLSHSALMSYYSSSSQSHLFLDPYYSPSETTETPVTSSTSSSSFQFRSFFSLSNFRKSFKPPSSSASTSGFSTILSSFRSSLALFLPAVSRISLGTTISGSLKNAQIAIPQGTLFSLLGGLIVYLAIVWVCGLGVDVETLMYPDSSDSSLTSLTFNPLNSFSFFIDVARSLWNKGEDPSELSSFGSLGDNLTSASAIFAFLLYILVIVGILLSSLTSALVSLFGAPRMFSVLVNDGLIKLMLPLGRASEPFACKSCHKEQSIDVSNLKSDTCKGVVDAQNNTKHDGKHEFTTPVSPDSLGFDTDKIPRSSMNVNEGQEMHVIISDDLSLPNDQTLISGDTTIDEQHSRSHVPHHPCSSLDVDSTRVQAPSDPIITQSQSPLSSSPRDHHIIPSRQLHVISDKTSRVSISSISSFSSVEHSLTAVIPTLPPPISTEVMPILPTNANEEGGEGQRLSTPQFLMEPRRMYVFTCIISLIGAALGDSSFISPFLAGLSLFSYVVVNSACFVMHHWKLPGFRPKFPLSNRVLSLVGILMCVLLFFLLPLYCSLSVVIIVVVFMFVVDQLVRRREKEWLQETEEEEWHEWKHEEKKRRKREKDRNYVTLTATNSLDDFRSLQGSRKHSDRSEHSHSRRSRKEKGNIEEDSNEAYSSSSFTSYSDSDTDSDSDHDSVVLMAQGASIPPKVPTLFDWGYVQIARLHTIVLRSLRKLTHFYRHRNPKLYRLLPCCLSGFPTFRPYLSLFCAHLSASAHSSCVLADVIPFSTDDLGISSSLGLHSRSTSGSYSISHKPLTSAFTGASSSSSSSSRFKAHGQIEDTSFISAIDVLRREKKRAEFFLFNSSTLPELNRASYLPILASSFTDGVRQTLMRIETMPYLLKPNCVCMGFPSNWVSEMLKGKDVRKEYGKEYYWSLHPCVRLKLRSFFSAIQDILMLDKGIIIVKGLSKYYSITPTVMKKLRMNGMKRSKKELIEGENHFFSRIPGEPFDGDYDFASIESRDTHTSLHAPEDDVQFFKAQDKKFRRSIVISRDKSKGIIPVLHTPGSRDAVSLQAKSAKGIVSHPTSSSSKKSRDGQHPPPMSISSPASIVIPTLELPHFDYHDHPPTKAHTSREAPFFKRKHLHTKSLESPFLHPSLMRSESTQTLPNVFPTSKKVISRSYRDKDDRESEEDGRDEDIEGGGEKIFEQADHHEKKTTIKSTPIPFTKPSAKYGMPLPKCYQGTPQQRALHQREQLHRGKPKHKRRVHDYPIGCHDHIRLPSPASPIRGRVDTYFLCDDAGFTLLFAENLCRCERWQSSLRVISNLEHCRELIRSLRVDCSVLEIGELIMDRKMWEAIKKSRLDKSDSVSKPMKPIDKRRIHGRHPDEFSSKSKDDRAGREESDTALHALDKDSKEHKIISGMQEKVDTRKMSDEDNDSSIDKEFAYFSASMVGISSSFTITKDENPHQAPSSPSSHSKNRTTEIEHHHPTIPEVAGHHHEILSKINIDSSKTREFDEADLSTFPLRQRMSPQGLHSREDSLDILSKINIDSSKTREFDEADLSTFPLRQRMSPQGLHSREDSLDVNEHVAEKTQKVQLLKIFEPRDEKHTSKRSNHHQAASEYSDECSFSDRVVTDESIDESESEKRRHLEMRAEHVAALRTAQRQAIASLLFNIPSQSRLTFGTRSHLLSLTRSADDDVLISAFESACCMTVPRHLHTVTARLVRLCAVIQSHSHDAAAVVISLPLPRETRPMVIYVAWLEMLSSINCPVFFTRGGGEVCLSLEA